MNYHYLVSILVQKEVQMIITYKISQSITRCFY